MDTGRFYADWWASPTEAHIRVFKDGIIDSAVKYAVGKDPTPEPRLVHGRIYVTEYDKSPSNLVLRVVDLCKKAGFPSHKLTVKVPIV